MGGGREEFQTVWIYKYFLFFKKNLLIFTQIMDKSELTLIVSF